MDDAPHPQRDRIKAMLIAATGLGLSVAAQQAAAQAPTTPTAPPPVVTAPSQPTTAPPAVGSFPSAPAPAPAPRPPSKAR